MRHLRSPIHWCLNVILSACFLVASPVRSAAFIWTSAYSGEHFDVVLDTPGNINKVRDYYLSKENAASWMKYTVCTEKGWFAVGHNKDLMTPSLGITCGNKSRREAEMSAIETCESRAKNKSARKKSCTVEYSGYDDHSVSLFTEYSINQNGGLVDKDGYGFICCNWMGAKNVQSSY